MAPKFTLQTVLEVRHSKVESTEMELGKLLQLEQQKKTVIMTMENVINTLNSKMCEMMVGEIDLFMLNHLRENINSLNNQLKEAQQQLEILQTQIVEKRRELVIAKQAEETLDILKNKEIESYNAEQAAMEQRIQDDIYIAKGFERHP